MATGLESVRIGVLGVGNMGGAIVRGVVAADLVPREALAIADVDAEKVDALHHECGVAVAADLPALAAAADLLVLAVKPQGVRAALDALAPHVQPDRHCVVSIAAGIPLAALSAPLPQGTRIVRVMPNTPALVGQGMSAVSGGPEATEADLARVERLFGTLGRVVRVEERHLDAITAVSGSGPAYVFHLAECLGAAAGRVGLPAHIIEPLVTQTILGAATLLAQSEDSAATLRARVTSPGGTTEAALHVLEDRDLFAIWAAAVDAATRRGAELARLA